MAVTKIISGGQTGADQGGLLGAQALGIETGGWAPKGWRTELGRQERLLKGLGLQEHSSPDYPPRTRRNVEEADGTVLFGTLASPGSRLTKSYCEAEHRPFIHDPTPKELWDWCELHQIRTLNVAGNRESRAVGIQEWVRKRIIDTFKPNAFPVTPPADAELSAR